MNENDIERKLQQEPLATPSPGLDQRMDALFDEAASISRRSLLPVVPLWLATVACLTCGIAGFVAHRLFIHQQSPSTVVIVVPPNEVLGSILTGTGVNRRDRLDLSRPQIRIIRQENPITSSL